MHGQTRFRDPKGTDEGSGLVDVRLVTRTLSTEPDRTAGTGPRPESGMFSVFPLECPQPARERADALVRENLQFIWRFLRRLGLAASDADDATQRVFFAAVQKIERIQPGSERAFLCRTALRIALKIQASSKRRREAEHTQALESLADPAPSPEELSDRQRARDLLDQVLEAMPLELRAVFILFEVEHMTTTEIAETLGTPRGTTASRLRRARADFEQRVLRLEARLSFRGASR